MATDICGPQGRRAAGARASVTGLPYDDAPESDAWSIDPDLPDDEVGVAIMGFLMLVRLGPEDAGLARLGVEAIVRALGDASGPDTPTPGMMGIPALIEDGLARAALADASPSAREVLGDLERALVGLGPSAAAAAAARIRTAIRSANDRLAGGAPPDDPNRSPRPHPPE